jgi:A/G-specific adenine glycosylase
VPAHSQVDGNVHRLLTRLLAVHATQTSPATIKFLWQAAEELVEALPADKGVAGDWNQVGDFTRARPNNRP